MTCARMFEIGRFVDVGAYRIRPKTSTVDKLVYSGRMRYAPTSISLDITTSYSEQPVGFGVGKYY